MRLGDIEQSRAVLIGAASYAVLPGLPAVRQNLIDLRRLLMDPTVWGLPREHCVALTDEESVGTIMDAVHEAADKARDTLLVYYAGHGHLDQAMGLRLATPASDPARPYRSVKYDDIRHEIMDAVRCPSKVVILDCCYSGQATHVGMGPATEMAERAAVEGSWLITASAEHVPAISPPDEPHTAFTGELIRLLDQGIEGGPEFLDVLNLYRTLHERLTAKGRPEPQHRIGNHGAQIVIARNRGRDHRRTAGVPAAPPEELRGLPTALDDLIVLVDARRARNGSEAAGSLLHLIGRHRDTQEVAATLAEFGYQGRTGDVDALLDGVAGRATGDLAAVLDVLSELDARAAIDAVLAREAEGPCDRIAELAAAALPESCLNQLLDAVVSASLGRPKRMSELIGDLLGQNRSAEADHLINQCRAQGDPAELAAIADALRDTDHETAAFHLYPAAIDELVTRSPEEIAALALGFHRHGEEKAAAALAAEAAAHRGVTPDRADLLVAFSRVKGLENEVVRITEIFAADIDDKDVEDLPRALRDRGGDTVDLHLAVLSRQPIEAVLQSVNNLVHNARPRDVFAILRNAAATRPAADLDTLTEGLHDTPERRHRRLVFTAVVSRTDCTVQLYRRLHHRADGRIRTLRAVLITQPPPILLDVVVHLVRDNDSALGGELLRYADEAGPYAVSDALIEYADTDTAELLVLAAVGLPDLMRIVYALRQKGLYLEYTSDEAARLLLHQPARSAVVVVRALYTAEGGVSADRIAYRLARFSPAWVAYLLEILAQRGDTGLAGPQLEMVTARAIVAQAARYEPGDAAGFVIELGRRGLQRVVPQYLSQWTEEHRTGVDAFLLAAALGQTFGPHMISKMLQGRAYLPERYWTDAVATAVSEVLHHVHADSKAIHRFPVPAAMVERLVSSGVLPDTEYCLLVIQFKAILGREVVFTESGVRYGVNNLILYADLARADGVQSYLRKVWLTRSGVAYLVTWTMRSEAEAEALTDVLTRIRRRIVEVRNRYAELRIEPAPMRIESRVRPRLPRNARS
jgi:hypothetical protein